MRKFNGEIDFHNSSNFTSETSDQIRFLQQIQIETLRQDMTYESVITLDQKARKELSWWITNMKIYSGKSAFCTFVIIILCFLISFLCPFLIIIGKWAFWAELK